ncbi:uncharacterized protein [Chamaea fasciata]|uniref:uncharacterized protein isoform X2 n=1 Tax=Chamaea fasciata TaxID=190680 RepID=UPI003369FC40
MVKLFIGNLPREATEQEIRSLFEQYGKVLECDIIKNYGFVHIEDKTAAEDAIRNLHHHKLHGVCINVEASKNKSKASTKLHVGNISPACTNLELRAKFEEYGPVIECDIVKDYAFVHMERAEDAVEAIRGLDNTEFQGAVLLLAFGSQGGATCCLCLRALSALGTLWWLRVGSVSGQSGSTTQVCTTPRGFPPNLVGSGRVLPLRPPHGAAGILGKRGWESAPCPIASRRPQVLPGTVGTPRVPPSCPLSPQWCTSGFQGSHSARGGSLGSPGPVPLLGGPVVLVGTLGVPGAISGGSHGPPAPAQICHRGLRCSDP